jgi:photosystem II stability/assembly factor-like uncharacterized protein
MQERNPAMVDYPIWGRLPAAPGERSSRSRISLIAIACAVIAGAMASASDTVPIEKTLRDDAALADVFFTDARNGWAVGDRGVIWHTDDGGTTWAQQNSNVKCRLNSVCFIDRNRGWIVGGQCRPGTRSTQGIILRTENGGVSWAAVPVPTLPLLTRIKFFDPNVGVAIGHGSQSQPSGVFVTRDSGQTWQAFPTDDTGYWITGDFFDASTGAVAGSSGRFATIARNQVVQSPLTTPSLRSFHAMRLTAPAGGWIVGDGGLVMSTSDGGRSWQSPPTDVLNDAAGHFDFHALAVDDQKVWMAGTPGTRVFRSQDGGHTWQSFDTGHFAPIRALAFVDAQHGWAVGDLGCMLATHDGGSTWQVQREGGRRAAVLAVFTEVTDVPLELLAQTGAAEGYIAAVNIMHGQDDAPIDKVVTTIAAGESMLLAGAATSDTAWQFPLPDEGLCLTPDDYIAALNRSTDGRAIELLERHLVRQLRMWRPNVVVTHHVERETHSARDSQSSGKSKPAAALLEQLLLRAVTAAADPEKFVDLSSIVGLSPWQVNKVYGVLPAGIHGDEHFETNRFSAALRATPADFATIARRLLSPQDVSAADVIDLRSLMSNVAETTGQPGIFSGIPLSYGSDARRAAPELAEGNVDALRRLATRRRHLQQLLERTEGNAAWAGQVAQLIKGLDSAGGGELLLQLAEGYRATGNLDLAADTYYLLTRQYPGHPMVDTALMWLVQFYASEETAHRAAIDQSTHIRRDAAVKGVAIGVSWTEGETGRGGQGQNSSGSPPLPVSPSPTLHHVANATPAVGLSHDDRLRRAVQLTEYLRTARPQLYAEPLVRFAEVTAQRRLGYANEAKRYFLSLRPLPESHAWRRCAASEEWLANPGDIPPPKKLAACRRATARPFLDGRLDEPFWKTADILRLRGDQNGGEVRLAYDNEFIYLAISCPKITGVEYPKDDRARPRDADLSHSDRVELQFDLDRDFSTAYSLSLDSRGWCRDACWDDINWNPTWYIAAADDETTWTVEAAVPLAELTSTPPAARHVWAASARRTIPRVGYESWAGETDGEQSPNQFGLLIFE